MKNEPKGEGRNGPASKRSTRRQMLRTGAIVVPTIITLHASPAWARTDYTVFAYRYGVNAGKCRNPHYNPEANPNSQAGQEFIDCPSRGGRRREAEDQFDRERQQSSDGPIEIQIR